MLGLTLAHVCWKPSSGQFGDSVLRTTVQDNRLPSQRRRRDPYGPNRMSDIMVAIPERSFSIFPRFTPMDGSQTDEERLRRERMKKLGKWMRGKFCPEFEPMLLRRIVVEPWLHFQTVKSRYEDVAFRRMQVA